MSVLGALCAATLVANSCSSVGGNLRTVYDVVRATDLTEGAQRAYRGATTPQRFQGAAQAYERVATAWEAAGIPHRASAALYFTGRAHFLSGRPDSALRAYTRARALLTTKVTSRLASELARADATTDTLTVEELDRALQREIGAVYVGLGRADSALTFLRNIVHAPFDVHHLDPGFEYDADTRAARMSGRSGAAIPEDRTFYQPATHVYEWTAIAAAYLDLGHPDSALTYLRAGATEARRVRGGDGLLAGVQRVVNDVISDVFFSAPRFEHESRLRTKMAEAFVRLGQSDSARWQYQRVVAIDKPDSRLLRTSDRAGLGRALLGLGDLLILMGHPDSAAVYLQQARELAQTSDDMTTEAMAHYGLARYFERSTDVADQNRALFHYDSAAGAKARGRNRAPGDESRLSVVERTLAIEQDWALALLRAPPEAFSSQRAQALASLAAVERGRARALLDFLADSSVAPSVDVGTDLVATGDTLVRNAVRGRRSVLSYLHTRDTLIIYLLGPDGSVDVSMRAVTLDSLTRVVTGFRTALGGDAVPDSSTDSREESPLRAAAGVRGVARGDAARSGRLLADLLLPNGLNRAIASSTELLIVPSGLLHTVAFAALPADSATLLGEVVPLRFAPSLSVAIQLASAAVGSTARGAATRPLLVGDPAMPLVAVGTRAPQRLPPLPGAAAEIRWLATRLDALPLTGIEATRDAVLAALDSSTLVHLATHGFAYSATFRARESFVAVAPQPTHAGLLTVGELLDHPGRLRADLVVLSACQTGLGDIRRSEGVLGLQRAFLAKGARGVLASLWSISDEATRLLMERFYTHWLDDADSPSAAQALQRASLDVRRTPGFEHPRYWAAFQLVGGN